MESSTSSSLPSKNRIKSTINKLRKLRKIKMKIIQSKKMTMTMTKMMMKHKKVH